MTYLVAFIVCFIAGIGAGLGTGFAGMSAAAVISPMLITFLGMDPYMAVGIALASDVLASAVSAYTYGKSGNLDIKNGAVMMASVLCFTLVGSYVASLVPGTTMGGFSTFMTLLLGVKFIVRPVMTTKSAMNAVSVQKRFAQSLLCGAHCRQVREQGRARHAEPRDRRCAGRAGRGDPGGELFVISKPSPEGGSHATNKQQSRAVFTLLGYSYAFLASPSGKTTNKPPSRTHLAAAGCFSAKVFQNCMTALPVSCCADGFPAAR